MDGLKYNWNNIRKKCDAIFYAPHDIYGWFFASIFPLNYGFNLMLVWLAKVFLTVVKRYDIYM